MRAPVLALGGLPPGVPTKGARVHLKLAIGRDGLVKSADLLSQAADPNGQALAKAAMQWEFVAAMKAGQPVEITAVVEISF
jgi:hypothetical protein